MVTDVSGQLIGPVFRGQMKDSYRIFGTTYRSLLQGRNEELLPTFRDNLSVPSSGVSLRIVTDVS